MGIPDVFGWVVLALSAWGVGALARKHRGRLVLAGALALLGAATLGYQQGFDEASQRAGEIVDGIDMEKCGPSKPLDPDAVVEDFGNCRGLILEAWKSIRTGGGPWWLGALALLVMIAAGGFVGYTLDFLLERVRALEIGNLAVVKPDDHEKGEGPEAGNRQH